jgi:IS5 family transposase
MAVAPWIVSEELWKRFEPLLPKKRITADRGYDHDKYRLELRRYRIAPDRPSPDRARLRPRARSPGLSSAPSPGCTTSSGCVRYDRRAESHEAFLALGCCLVCFRRLRRSF